MGPAMYNHDKQRERSEERGVRKERSEERKSATEGCLKRQARREMLEERGPKCWAGAKRSEVPGPMSHIECIVSQGVRGSKGLLPQC